jgi:hypothetical protein
MRKQIKFLVSLFLLGSIFLTSCTKEVVGPEGPAGKDGKDGNANVTAYSATLTPSNWTTLGAYGQEGYGFGAIVQVPAITQEIVDVGTVLVYLSATPGMVPLPYTDIYDGYTINVLYAYRAGEIVLNIFRTDFMGTPPSTFTIKIVVIDGSYQIDDNLDLGDYKQVTEYFDLK